MIILKMHPVRIEKIQDGKYQLVKWVDISKIKNHPYQADPVIMEAAPHFHPVCFLEKQTHGL